jgi:hypothetical protein
VAAADTSASAVSSAVPQTVTANSITAPAGSAAEAAAGSTASAKSGAGEYLIHFGRDQAEKFP